MLPILLVKVEGSLGGKLKWKSKVWLPALNQLSESKTHQCHQKVLEFPPPPCISLLFWQLAFSGSGLSVPELALSFRDPKRQGS